MIWLSDWLCACTRLSLSQWERDFGIFIQLFAAAQLSQVEEKNFPNKGSKKRRI
jgi:hypothetical protein